MCYNETMPHEPQITSDDSSAPLQGKKLPRRRFLKGLAGVAVLAAIGKGVDLLLPMTICRPGEWNGPVTDHFDGMYFYNPEHANRHKTNKASSIFGWFFRKRIKGEYPIVQTNTHRPQLAPVVNGADWEVTMVNHSTMLVRIGGLNILTDPVWSDCTSPVQWAGPKRTRPVGIAWDDLPRIDVCLISHDHYDHFDAATLKKLYERDNPLFIVPLGLKSLLQYHTDASPRCEEKDWWDTVQLNPSVSCTLTPALHWSRRYRSAASGNRSLWCGFFMQVKGGPSVYFAGDTAAGTIFDTIRRRLGAPTLALLPIGAYRPDWIRTHHTNPADAVQVFRQLQAQQAIACHFGTWQLADEGYQETLGDLATALREAGIPPHLFPAPDNGQTLRGSAH